MNRNPDRPRNHPRRLWLLLAPLALALAIGVAACGSDQDSNSAAGGEPEQFDLALDFYVNPDHVGIFAAIDGGHFAAEGLEVNPRVPSDPAAPIKQVVAGRVDLAVSYQPEVLLARDQGLDVVAVAALVNGPLTSLISLPSAGIDSAAELAGKTIVTAGIPYQAAYLETIFARADVDPESVDVVDVGFNLMPPLLSGRADAIFGAFLNVEGVDLKRRGVDPRIVPVDQLGVPTYDELVLVASGERLREDPEAIESFLAGLRRGTFDAAADPEAGVAALLKAGEGLEPKLTAAQVKETIPRLLGPGDRPYGYMDPKRWETFARFMKDAGQIETAPTAPEMLSNELLPAGG